jgi:hypothetical protein
LHGGLFVVSGGELESWLKSLGVKGHGSDDISSHAWLTTTMQISTVP